MPKTFTQTRYFEAPPSTLFRLYTDAGLHAEATGAGAAISPKEGSAFTAWDGYIGGITLHVVKDRMVVQTWRSSDWGDRDPDSILILLLEPEGSGTRLRLTHANVPDGEADALKKGWIDYYWKPWKAWLDSR